MLEAAAIVAERRGPALSSCNQEVSRGDVFSWVNGHPTAGGSAMLAYNKRHGPLRCGVRCICLSARMHSPCAMGRRAVDAK
jgi:hypothetical protein